MVEQGDTPPGAPIDRSDRPGHIGLVLLLAACWSARSSACASSGASGPSPSSCCSPFSRWPACSSCLRRRSASFSSRAGGAQRHHEAPGRQRRGGLAVIDDEGRIIYANERLFRPGRRTAARIRTVERLFTGAPEVSEAIYRLAQAAREQRAGSGGDPPLAALGGLQEFGWYRVRVRPLPRPGGRTATLWTVADVTHERERQENVFQELQHAIDYLDHAPAGFLSIDPEGAIVYLNATLAAWLDYDLAQVGSGGLTPRRRGAARTSSP